MTEVEFNKELGQRLRQARRERGLSLLDVEHESEGEFKASAVGCYERGDRSMTAYRLDRLCGLYGHTAAELLAGDRSSSAISALPVSIRLDDMAAASGIAAEAVEPGRGRRVLVVDDDATTRELLTTALRLEGYETMTGADGVMALELLSQCDFDAVILDTVMPRMDGLTVLRAIRSDVRLADLPVLVLSGLDDISQLQQAVEAGASGYVTKPFALRDVTEQVQRIGRPAGVTQRNDA